MAIERTLVIIKPDGVQRGLIGDIIHRFERVGLKLAAMKMMWPDEELAGEHYAADEAYMKGVGEKALASARERGQELAESALEIGQRIRQYNMRFLSVGPVVAIVLEGNTAIQTTRNIIGGTNPLTADVGTIRGDLTIDDFTQADAESRTVRNLIHASDSLESAAREIALWFGEDEVFAYQTVMDKVLHDPHWDAPRK